MKTSTEEKETVRFLVGYASWLAGCGATCIRILKNVNRMADKFGIDADVEIMPNHIRMTMSDGTTIMSGTRHCGVNFDLNARLSRLSWAVADGKINQQQAQEQLEKDIRTRPTYPFLVLALVSVANASFCRLFGGDPVAMVIVFLATLAGYYLKQIMLADGFDVRITFLCCSFFSATIAASGHIFGLSSTPEIALGASVLYLVPGVPYINSVSDLIDRHYLCAFYRFIDAAVLTACLSLGLCAGMFILGLNWF